MCNCRGWMRRTRLRRKLDSVSNTSQRQRRFPPPISNSSLLRSLLDNTSNTALEKIVGSKVSKSKATSDLMLKSATAAGSADDAQYLKYQVDKNAPGYNPDIKSRVIKVISAQVDPMEPPKHKHRKVPGGPAEDPVPILHSPPKKLTLEDQVRMNFSPLYSSTYFSSYTPRFALSTE